MKTIFLQGKGNTGKTETLKTVIKFLLAVSGTRVVLKSRNFDNWVKGLPAGDIWVVLTYNGKTVYINTEGDAPEKIVSDYNKIVAKRNNIDVIIGASHKTAKANAAITRISGGDPVILLDKSIATTSSAIKTSNISDADVIIKHI